MSKVIKLREYFVAWILFVFGAIGGGALAGGILGGIIGAITGALGGNVSAVVPIIRIGSLIAGLTMSFVMFVWVVRSMIVRKVEERVKQAAQTAGESLVEC